jgi:uncharacterized protein
MNFWQRRPIGENVIGLLLALLLWWALWIGFDVAIRATLPGLPNDTLGALLASIITTVVVVRFYDRQVLAWAGLGIHRWMPRELAIGAALGMILALVAWAPGAVAGSVTAAEGTPAPLVVEIAAGLLVGAVVEELIFRGYAFQRLVEITGALTATVLVSALFAVAHLQNPSITPLAAANVFLASVFFSLAYFATGSLWLPMAAHAAWNMTLALVLGVPVSGYDFSVGWLRTIDGSAPVIGGGAFGPEGGLAATAALLVGIVALVRLPAVSVSPYVHASVFASVYRRERQRLGPGRSRP